MFDQSDAVLLARIQFAFTISFHFLFPAFTIGLASYLALLNALWLRTREHKYLDLFRYWVKIFAISFAMGVVSGIVMSYQFGTNWAVFADRNRPVLGAPMAYEVLSAFFLEAGFLGIMLFGRDKVGPGLHMFACLMVAAGTAISAFWIISVNSWMHTPQGFLIDANTGQFIPESFWEIVFNPSFPHRLAHTVTAAYLTTAFIVGGVGALHRHEYLPFVLALLLFGLCFAGLGLSIYPYVVPVEVTLLEAAAPARSQVFMLVGAAVLIPLILGYTGYAYWVFRGKIDPESGYH